MIIIINYQHQRRHYRRHDDKVKDVRVPEQLQRAMAAEAEAAREARAKVIVMDVAMMMIIIYNTNSKCKYKYNTNTKWQTGDSCRGGTQGKPGTKVWITHDFLKS